ncbi:MAG: hypothetical protein F6K36_26865 [Symploca sp. SIO3C6]|uniref:Uncharacterized protein n=1 Tax=Symploca sp. SIO1C4 TaxID=2607765 RepID=A0A6B3NG22_9CYAN|nr:hypothetical protein [Symploca sp. SIO3C6]NER28954.1 hypothetical protein [Symploca sp. SIO1C4]NET05912.1 hypothetical protein [Symploca sp. SIO2B6]
MTYLDQPEKIASHNWTSSKILMRAIIKSQGDFSLILARCNCRNLREGIVQQLQEHSPVEITELVLDHSVNTLYTTISEELGNEQPSVVMVSSLESVSSLDQLLVATNQVREEFRNFACPVVLWVTDEVLKKLIRLVPDFENWATSVEFAGAVAESARAFELEAA